MTEEERRRIALEIFAQEQIYLQNRASTVLSTAQTNMEASLARSAKRKAVFDSLSQNGITWHDLKAAYDDAFARGHEAMIDFKLAYFYAGAAIAVHEYFNTSPEQCAVFIRLLLDIAEEYPEKESIVSAALNATGVDTLPYDVEASNTIAGRARMPANARATKADEKAIARMKRTGITKADLEYEKSVGYQAGWNNGFGYSVCYASLALALFRSFNFSKEEIEAVFDRVSEQEYEEISAADIIERAREEAGVDVSRLSSSPN